MVVSTSEKLRDHELIENAFNCKVHNQYGCREVIARSPWSQAQSGDKWKHGTLQNPVYAITPQLRGRRSKKN